MNTDKHGLLFFRVLQMLKIEVIGKPAARLRHEQADW
jgi:hypothetical protein